MTDSILACKLQDILPGCGVCALINDQQVAIFRPDADETVYALHNYDPFAHANVISRGLLGEHDDTLYVASPLNKKRFCLKTGVCLDDETVSLQRYETLVDDGLIYIHP